MKKFRKILLVDDDETSNFLTQLVIEEINLASHPAGCESLSGQTID
jgi:hypothetical protein